MTEAQQVLTEEQVRAFADVLRTGACPAGSVATVGLIGALEDVKRAACGVQAEAAVVFDAARRAEQAAAGVPAARQGRGIGHEIALARRESPHRGMQHLGFAKVASAEMPHTLARVKDGSIEEYTAQVLLRETACLAPEHRATVDERLCADPAALEGVGTGELAGRARKLAATLDPGAVARRARNAEADRKVTIRPAPDTMTFLTILLPVAQGVAVFAWLGTVADQLRAAGDPRSRAQLMVDLLISRVTGTPMTTTSDVTADGEVPIPAVPVGVNVTVSDETLAGGTDPGTVDGDGVPGTVVPAEVARLIVAAALDAEVAAWFRRLYLNPHGKLVAMSSKSRVFPPGLVDFLNRRGLGICANPWCDAPIRHADHIRPVTEGGPTSAANGQGLCEACNHAKQAPGWRQAVVSTPGQRHRVETQTPTGHRYTSQAPPPPGWKESA